MELDWSVQTIEEWRKWLQKVPRSNCMQSWPYAKAVRAADQKTTCFATVKENGEVIGIAAIQQVQLGPILFLNLYRGPLWLSETDKDKKIIKFAKIFSQNFPKRWLTRRRWLPEGEYSSDVKDQLIEMGFKIKIDSYKTIWLDLRFTEEEIRSLFKQKWRNALNKCERSPLQLKVDLSGLGLSQFLLEYARHRRSKKYFGPSPEFIRAEVTEALPVGECLLLNAFLDEQPVGGVLLLLHGNSASYRVGWTTDVGKKYNAHNGLLWSAIRLLKKRNIEFFDLGGINANDHPGLSRFKRGLGGKEITMPGVFS